MLGHSTLMMMIGLSRPSAAWYDHDPWVERAAAAAVLSQKGQRVLNQNIRNCTPFDSHLSGKVIGLLSSLFYPFFFFVFLRLFTKRLWSYWYWYHTWGQLIARAWNGNLVNGKRVKPTSQFCALFHCSRWLLFPSKDLLYCSRGLNSTTDNFYVSPLYNTGNPRWFTRNCFKNTTKKRQNYYRRLK